MSYRIEAATKEEWAERALSGEKKLDDLKDSIMQKVPEGVFCKCGGRSVVFDTWFSYFPCREHKHLNPVEYSRLPTETKEQTND